MHKLKTLAETCDRCAYSTETDMPCGLIDNCLWCEYGCGITRKNRWCKHFMQKRKFKRENIVFVAPCEYEEVQR